MTEQLKQLHGRPCLVTGGGTGIGRGTALCLAAAGAEVGVTGRRLEPLEQTVAMIRDRGGVAHACVMDVTDQGSVEQGLATLGGLMDLPGRLHLLVNNAGTGGPNICAMDGPDNWDAIIRTNLDGIYFTTRAAIPLMPDHSRVVNISSVLGKFGVPGYTAYCTSKHGVIGFTKALALELAPRQITVNAICPGWVETEMAKAGIQGIADATGKSYAEAFEGAMAMVPLGRIMQPEEIGGLVVYLASGIAGGMTGQAISLCGGQTMG
jgi:NAD(P)-dependent dehydrogenase (short-subunit alcohol dehydrogenase family)